MELNLEKAIIFFDIESTGLNIAKDSIFELCFIKVLPNNELVTKTWKIKPWDYENHCQKSISEGAKEVTGVKDKDLKDYPRFFEVAEDIIDMMEDCDFAGFNSAKFDLPLLAEELERVDIFYKDNKSEKAQALRAKLQNIDLHAARMVDVQSIFHLMEPRNLKAAYRFYCQGQDLENAHTAEADTMATYEVLKGQLTMYQEVDNIRPFALRNDIDFLSSLHNHPQTVDFAGRIGLDEHNEPFITFGKHKGVKLKEVWQKEPAFFAWIAQGDFTLDTKKAFENYKKQFEQERKQRDKSPASAEQLSELLNKFNRS